MTLYRNKYRMESTRLHGYDYSRNGCYFITICSDKQQDLFGKMTGGKMTLNDPGKIISDCWNDLPNHYRNLILDEFVTMPNHIHCIMIIDNDLNNGLPVDPVETGCFVETGLRPVSTVVNIH